MMRQLGDERLVTHKQEMYRREAAQARLRQQAARARDPMGWLDRLARGRATGRLRMTVGWIAHRLRAV
jgi:hypothetical protein